ncbi:hypothetical protein H8B15_05865 [Hymenobacter sp. BT507]|uniref:Uncharacterized protein n=1 Tax=Hymenobacter citatus TaxID=2763506 RepID=A0ABR7MIK6_9BACT|nr:hypothetical protein [Hymenobacter citatus]MBC6610437.1 hypothetical protein [Hymenobacter citatus]
MRAFYSLLLCLFISVGSAVAAKAPNRRPDSHRRHTVSDMFKPRMSHFGTGKPLVPMHKRVKHAKEKSLNF